MFDETKTMPETENTAQEASVKKWDFDLITELDSLLIWFSKWENRGSERTFIDIYADLSNNVYNKYRRYVKDIAGIIRVCLKKLVTDGYVHERERIARNLNDGTETKETVYSITFEGLLFLQTEKSYIKFYEKEQRQTRSQNVKDFLLISGAWVASLAGSGLLYFEYIKLPHHLYRGVTFGQLFLFVSILSLPVWIYLSPVKLRRLKRQAT